MAEEVFKPRDAQYLWWMGTPAQPRLVGEVSLVSGGRSVALQYSAEWLRSGFALSDDLPLTSDLFVPSGKDTAAGAVDDARPDRWGERVIRKFEKSSRLSILEYLLFAGDDRYGALGVSQSASEYLPWPSTPLPRLDSLDDIAQVVRKVLDNEPVPEPQRRLIRPGVSLGGARPKSVIDIDGHPWLVKFPEGEALDMPLIEHAAMTLASRCAIHAAPTRALELTAGHAVAVRRFDRAPRHRSHAISAFVALRAVGEELGYPQLAQLLRRHAPAGDIRPQQQELFRRMVFNILMDNTDDHEKNHGLLRNSEGNYTLAPAFDVVPSAQGLGYQGMLVGSDGAASSLDNAMSQSTAFGMKKKAAQELIREVAIGIDGWKDHFKASGVADADIEVLARFIDSDRLAGQRREFLR